LPPQIAVGFHGIIGTLNDNRRALTVNLDEAKYGTFAQIDAGQEVARQFFQAGGAELQGDQRSRRLNQRFQTEPKTLPSVIILHVRMLDKENVRQWSEKAAAAVIRERHLFCYKKQE
jgi:hypothetical protein